MNRMDLLNRARNEAMLAVGDSAAAQAAVEALEESQ